MLLLSSGVTQITPLWGSLQEPDNVVQRHLHWVVERNEPMAMNLDDSSAGCVCHIVGLRVAHRRTEYIKGESDAQYQFHQSFTQSINQSSLFFHKAL